MLLQEFVHPRVSFTNTTEVKTSLGFSTNPFSGSFQECFVFQTSEPEKLFKKKLGNNFFLFADKKYLENDKIDRSTSEKKVTLGMGSWKLTLYESIF